MSLTPSPFELLHSAVQHHVVNSLGWRSLRPHQEQAIAPILQGHHVLVQAPTAGGKTESALLPVLSRMLTEEWRGPSVIYLCPIKALLNNLEVRVSHLAGLVGRRVGVWHGDVGQAARKRLLRERPDILLATPESIEVMLVSRLVDHPALFASLRAAIVDEVHAFAGDDRGWHLLALLERLSTLAEAPVQRIALSATLANADELLTWLTARAKMPRTVVQANAAPAAEADVQVDYVGSLANAALVISRLHQGEKRLVFCDSRSQVEELAQELRARRVRTFVSHSSLGVDERRQAEAAFAEGSNCVIVATSTLELGIDVGDLDRVIQIDAPHSVAGFLQRIGRSGRRAGTRRNCLFLATSEDALLRALGLLRLWMEGFVEPVVPPVLPYHVVAQQVMAVLLQESGATRQQLCRQLDGFMATAGVAEQEWLALFDHLVETGVLFADGATMGLGPVGEERYGARHFLELFSVFNSPPLFSVLHGLTEIGQVHELTFRRKSEGPLHLALGGRGWRVAHLDWSRRRAWVEPAEAPGRSRWLGGGPPLHFRLAEAMGRALRHGVPAHLLSQRARQQLSEVQQEFSWLAEEHTTLVVEPAKQRARWWTFAGDHYNAAVAQWLEDAGLQCSNDGLGLDVAVSSEKTGAQRQLEELLSKARRLERPATCGKRQLEALGELKFIECVPPALQIGLGTARLSPSIAARGSGDRPIRVRWQE